MRITLGRGKRRQMWEISPQDYNRDRRGAEALFEYVGLPVFFKRVA